MALTDEIVEKVKLLPEEKQIELLDFVDFLQGKLKETERKEWSKFSIDSAMHGIEDDKIVYSLEDLKERFS